MDEEIYQNLDYDVPLPQGWDELIDRAFQDMKDIDPDCFIDFREEFGALMITPEASYGDEDIQSKLDLIAEKIEEESLSICMACGIDGEPRDVFGKVYTLCDEHYDEYGFQLSDSPTTHNDEAELTFNEEEFYD